MKNLKNTLSKPQQQSKPWALWIWNLAITKPEVEKQLNELIHKGFGGVAIRPCRDMSPPHMSEEFLELFETVLKIAAENNTGIRLADDFSMPWSNVFETITNQAKKQRAQYLVLEREIVAEDKKDIEIPLNSQAEYIALICGMSESAVKLADVKQIPVAQGQSTFSWKPSKENSSLLLLRKEYIHNVSGGYIPNTLSSRTTALYISTVLDILFSRFSKFMPATFEGFITEMPAYKPSQNAIPWDDELVVKYRAKYKKDLIKLLPAIFRKTANPSDRIKAQAYSFIYHSMYEKFALPLENWAKKHRLSQWLLCPETAINKTENTLTDMCIPSESSLSSVGFQNINGTEHSYALLRTMADCNTNEHRRETVTVIGRNSAAQASNIQDLKHEIDRSLLSGQSKILMDGFFFNYDQRNYIKTPFNTGWYSPEWQHLKELCDYSARVQELLCDTHASPQVAVLSPCSSLLAQYSPEDNGVVQRGLEQFEATVEELTNLNIDIDVVSEDQLLKTTVRQNGEFGTNDRIRKGNYSVLILPYSPLISRSVLVFLEKLISKQGAVLFIGQKPEGTFIDGTCSSIQNRIDKMIKSKKALCKAVSIKEIRGILPPIATDISLCSASGKPCTDINSSVHHNDSTKLYTIINRNKSQEQSCSIQLSKEKHYTLIDCGSEEIRELEAQEGKNHDLLEITLAPKQTIFIAASPTKLVPAGYKGSDSFIDPFALPQRNYRMVLKDSWDFHTDSLNALPLASWNSRMGLSRDSGGVIHFHESFFEVKTLPKSCYLVVAEQTIKHSTGDLSINGVKKEYISDLSLITDNQQIDKIRNLFGNSVAVYDITDALIKGANRISVIMSSAINEPLSFSYPPYIIGSFSISKGSQGWALETNASVAGQDSWAKYGYPYLTGSASYSQSFEVPNEYEKLILRFSQVSGTVYPNVNGTDLGSFVWQPLEVDITAHCEPRRNELTVKVVNTLDNILRMNGRSSGLIGEVFIDVY